MQAIDSNSKVRRNRYTRQINLIRPAFVVLAVLLLSGCSILQAVGIGKPPPPPPAVVPPPPPPPPLSEQPFEVTVILRADSLANPDSAGRPSPLRVLTFLAEPGSKLESASFDTVFGMSGDSVDAQPLSTLTLRPGERRSMVLESTRNNSQLTVAAGYRDPHSTQWLETVKLPDKGPVEVSMDLGEMTINTGLVRRLR